MNGLRNLAVIASLGGLLGLASPTADATTFRKMTQQERIDAAELIVRGTITEVWTERDDRGRIWTRAQVEVAEELKGSAPSVLVIDQLGGRYAGLRAEISGAARFSPGEDTVMFLATIKKGTRYTLQSMGLGKYTVRIDPHTGREVVQQFFPSLDDDYDHRFIPAPRDGQQVFLSDFETTILDRVEIAPTEVK